ncbi:MAG TPA: Xaa-Pro aminopeptidase [Candidatus Saccharimonadia bacterium]|jgi:Xaa-Pro aminopeptidase
MRYEPLPPKFHAAARSKLEEAIGPEAIAIIDTSDVIMRSADAEYPFRPDSNFYYLTGIAEPEAVLVLVPGHSNPEARQLLFVSGTNDFVGTWEGERLTPRQAEKLSGIKTVMPLSDLPRLLNRLLERYHTVYLNADESLDSHQSSPATRRARELRRRAPLHQLRSALPQLNHHRQIKDPAEIEQIRRAVATTKAGLERAWLAMSPGLPEYALEAELTAEYLRHGATGHAFTPIVAAGRNATIIHYMKNDAPLGDHDLVLFDTGAEMGWYASDISRVAPVSGRFTKRQRDTYEALRRAQLAGIARCKPGESIVSVDNHMREVLTEEIKKLGLKGPLFNYYPGHISHQMGLDAHDNSDFRAPLEPGMVITCEPGLYLKTEGIGVRLEDDLLITTGGCEVISRDIPSDPDQLEELLSKSAKS